ncbi:mitochondrial ribosome-associated GTPase 1, partial [Pelobates cultripes]
YVEKYGLDGPCPDIEGLLKKIALKLGKTQKVKALTGVGDVNITVPNYSAAAYDFIRTYRRGELGQMTLD